MAASKYTPIPRIAFVLLRLFQFLFAIFYCLALSGWIMPYPANITATIVPTNAKSPPGFPSLDGWNADWKIAAKDIAGISIIIIIFDVFLELRYGGLRFFFIRTRFDRPYLLDGLCAVTDLLFAATFATTAGYASRPFLGFTFPGKSCQHDAAEMSKTSWRVDPGFEASVYLCHWFSQIVVLSVLYSLTFILLAILRFVMRFQQQVLLTMIEEATRYGQYHISTQVLSFLSKPLWTPSPNLRAYCFHSTVSQDEVEQVIRKGAIASGRSHGERKEIKFGDDFYES